MSLLWHLDGISGCFFFVYDDGMEEYVARLIRAGVSACEAFYILQEHMYGHEESMYSYAPAPYSSNTEFGEVIQGKTDAEVYAVIDELMSALSVLNPPLYEQTLRKLK